MGLVVSSGGGTNKVTRSRLTGHRASSTAGQSARCPDLDSKEGRRTSRRQCRLRRLEVAVEFWPLNGTFTIARGAKTVAVVVVATIRGGGHVGRGEAVPYPRYGETVEDTVDAIRAMAPAVA